MQISPGDSSVRGVVSPTGRTITPAHLMFDDAMDAQASTELTLGRDAVASVAGVASLFTDQLLNVGNPPSKDAFKVIQNVTTDPSTIINTINDEDLENFWNNSIKVQFFNGFKQVTPGVEPPPQYTQLKNFIRLKNIVFSDAQKSHFSLKKVESSKKCVLSFGVFFLCFLLKPLFCLLF
jgi:hypothetical protein